MAGQLQTGYNFYQPAHTQPILMNTKCLNNYKTSDQTAAYNFIVSIHQAFYRPAVNPLSMQQINDHIEILFLNPEVPDL